MSDTIPTSLGDIRAAISKGRRVSFRYENVRIVADLYLLGQARRTGAFIVGAWCHEPIQEWRAFRYALIKDLEPVGVIDFYRKDFDPELMLIRSIDTLCPIVRKRPPN